MDGLGKSRLASITYRKLATHGTAAIARKAKGLLLGMASSSFLGVDETDLAVKAKDYTHLFERALMEVGDEVQPWQAGEGKTQE